ALNRVGAHQTMEDYLRYLNNIVASSPDGRLQPVYGITLEDSLKETVVDTLPGYRGMGPVRRGNQAYAHVQHDVYGEVVLAITQAFIDTRLLRPAGAEIFQRLEPVGEQAYRLHDQSDQGMWELRGRTDVHTMSSVMCWAACDRLARIAAHLGRAERAEHWRSRAEQIRKLVLERAWNDRLKCFVATFGGNEVDASLLLMGEVGFLEPQDPRFTSTMAAVEKSLLRGSHMFRYAVADDFGVPQNAFNVCTFWYIGCLAAVGRKDEGRELLENMLACRNHLGLLPEHLDPATGELWGNFPQTYSHVGLMNSAARLSRPWEDAL
ncbi:MAG: glycoside hydrolase family 15 protein, partial [Alphaproteobacteria bacterium]